MHNRGTFVGSHHYDFVHFWCLSLHHMGFAILARKSESLVDRSALTQKAEYVLRHSISKPHCKLRGAVKKKGNRSAALPSRRRQLRLRLTSQHSFIRPEVVRNCAVVTVGAVFRIGMATIFFWEGIHLLFMAPAWQHTLSGFGTAWCNFGQFFLFGTLVQEAAFVSNCPPQHSK